MHFDVHVIQHFRNALFKKKKKKKEYWKIRHITEVRDYRDILGRHCMPAKHAARKRIYVQVFVLHAVFIATKDTSSLNCILKEILDAIVEILNLETRNAIWKR